MTPTNPLFDLDELKELKVILEDHFDQFLSHWTEMAKREQENRLALEKLKVNAKSKNYKRHFVILLVKMGIGGGLFGLGLYFTYQLMESGKYVEAGVLGSGAIISVISSFLALNYYDRPENGIRD